MSASAAAQMAVPCELRGENGIYRVFDHVDLEIQSRIRRATGMFFDTSQRSARLGGGMDGEVYLGELIRTGKVVAIKIGTVSPELVDDVPHAIETLDRGSNFEVMEVAACGTLEDLLPKMGALPERLRDVIFYTVADGLLRALDGMQQKGRIHDDVKPDNIFLDEQGQVRLGDFGRSARLRRGADPLQRGAFRSPESGGAQFKLECDWSRSDSWAAGLTLLHLLAPADQVERCLGQLVAEIGSRWGGAADVPSRAVLEAALAPFDQRDEAWSLVHALLSLDPKERPTPAEALRHPWMVSMQRTNRKQVGLRIRDLIRARDLLGPSDLPVFPDSRRVHRIELEQQVVEAIGRSDRVVLVGGAGMGKSELAAALLQRADLPERRYWFHSADNAQALQRQLDQLAESVEGALLIFDNAEQDVVSRFIPLGARALITARRWEGDEQIAVGELTQTEADRLVQRFLQERGAETTSILDQVGRSPFAVTQACAYLLDGKTPDPGAAAAEDGKAAAYSIEEMVRQNLAMLPGGLRANLEELCCYECSSLPCWLVDGALLESPLLGAAPEGHFAIHRIIRDAVTRDPTLLRRAAQRLAEQFTRHEPTIEQIRRNDALLPHGLVLLRHLQEADLGAEVVRTEAWLLRAATSAKLHPILRELLGGDRPVEPTADGCQLLAARAAAYEELGWYAGSAHQAALQMAFRVLGEEHPITLDILEGAVGGGNLPGDQVGRVIELRGRSGPRDLELGRTWMQVGRYLQGKRSDWSQIYLERALQLWTGALGPHHPTVAIAMRELAHVDGSRSEELLRGAIAIETDLYSRGDPRRLPAILQLAGSKPEDLLDVLSRSLGEATAIFELGGESATFLDTIVQLTEGEMAAKPAARRLFWDLSQGLIRMVGHDQALWSAWKQRGDALGRAGLHQEAVHAYSHALGSRLKQRSALLYRVYLQFQALGKREEAEGAYGHWSDLQRAKWRMSVARVWQEQREWYAEGRRNEAERDPWLLALHSPIDHMLREPIRLLEEKVSDGRAMEGWDDAVWRRYFRLQFRTYGEPTRAWAECLPAEVVARLGPTLLERANLRLREEGDRGARFSQPKAGLSARTLLDSAAPRGFPLENIAHLDPSRVFGGRRAVVEDSSAGAGAGAADVDTGLHAVFEEESAPALELVAGTASLDPAPTGEEGKKEM